MSEAVTFTEAIECPYCANSAPMRELSKTTVYSQSTPVRGPYIEEFEKLLIWQIIECPACRKHLLREGWYAPLVDDENGPSYKVIHPTIKEKDYSLPPSIEKAYRAAQKVRHIDPNAFAVLLGRLLDMICLEKEAKGKSLSEKINNLSDRRVLPEPISQIALSLRALRNIGAHADLGELSEAEIPIVEELTNAILEYVYAAPAIVTKVRSEIEKLEGKGATGSGADGPEGHA